MLFRGQNEKINSNNRGTFLETIELITKLSVEFAAQLDKRPKTLC